LGAQVIRTNADLLHFQSAPSALESRIGGVDLIGAKVATQRSVRNATISKGRFIVVLLFSVSADTPLFRTLVCCSSVVIRRWFQPVFADRGNGFVQWDKSFRGRLADETSSQDRDRNPGC
jgi:hypothetical protein